MSLSIVIPTRTPANISACLQAIRQHEPGIPTSRIIVVDDDTAGAVAGVCATFGVTRIRGEHPFVFSRNINLGLDYAYCVQNARGAIILNDDALLSTPGGFSAMVDTREAYPSYGLVASSCNNVGNHNQEPQGDPGIRHEPRMLCFVCVLIPREVWERVGGLDEEFIGYGFDDDAYSVAVKWAGWRLGVFDGCYCDHASLTSTFRGREYPVAGFAYNEAIFKRKYGGH